MRTSNLYPFTQSGFCTYSCMMHLLHVGDSLAGLDSTLTPLPRLLASGFLIHIRWLLCFRCCIKSSQLLGRMKNRGSMLIFPCRRCNLSTFLNESCWVSAWRTHNETNTSGSDLLLSGTILGERTCRKGLSCTVKDVLKLYCLRVLAHVLKFTYLPSSHVPGQ
jgi:hypothetical protein